VGGRRFRGFFEKILNLLSPPPPSSFLERGREPREATGGDQSSRGPHGGRMFVL